MHACSLYFLFVSYLVGFEDPSFTRPAPSLLTSRTTEQRRLLQLRQLCKGFWVFFNWFLFIKYPVIWNSLPHKNDGGGGGKHIIILVLIILLLVFKGILQSACFMCEGRELVIQGTKTLNSKDWRRSSYHGYQWISQWSPLERFLLLSTSTKMFPNFDLKL